MGVIRLARLLINDPIIVEPRLTLYLSLSHNPLLRNSHGDSYNKRESRRKLKLSKLIGSKIWLTRNS